MSNATEQDIESMSDEELEKQALAEAEAKQVKAVSDEPEPTPEPVEHASSAPEPEKTEPPVTPSPTPEPAPSRPQAKDKDPMEWARAKGYKSPEEMARALLQKEQEYHASRQRGDGNPTPPPPPPPPTWNPQPTYAPPGYGYQPPMDRGRLAGQYQMDPEDFDRIARLAADMSKAAVAQERDRYEREISEIRHSTRKQNEFLSLMQDPAFTHPVVQQEMHRIVDSNPNLFQREGWQTAVYRQAMENLARKQLQQELGSGNSRQGGTPPVTAGGGNGSAHTAPRAITEKEFLSWPEEKQKAFLESNGRRIPRI